MAYAADTNEDMYSNLDEISAPEPVQNLDDSHDTSGSVSNTYPRLCLQRRPLNLVLNHVGDDNR